MILCRSSSVSAKMMSFIKPCASSKLWNNRCLILLMMQYSINSFSPFGLCLTNRQVAPRAADRSETPSPKKNTIGAGCIVVYGAIAFDLSCPKPLIHHAQSNAKQRCVMLPLGMTVLNVPAPIIVGFHPVRYYLNAVEASEVLVEHRTDDRFHTTAEV